MPSATVRYTSGAGQQRTITLPDGSVVVLNANSTLTTAAHWTAETPREVWLTGEGYFRVTHRAPRPVADITAAPAPIKFVVHAADLSIAVLGTQFDVNSRAGATKVVLASGKVAVERQMLLTREHLLMQPGDLVETSATPAAPEPARRAHGPVLGLDQRLLRVSPDPGARHFSCCATRMASSVADSAILRQRVSGAVAVTKAELLLPH